MDCKGRPQSMSFPQNYRNLGLSGKPKGIKRVLKEHGLWRFSLFVCHLVFNIPLHASRRAIAAALPLRCP